MITETNFLTNLFPNSRKHVTYEFESESTLCSCLNVKELLARKSSEDRLHVGSNFLYFRWTNHIILNETFAFPL